MRCNNPDLFCQVIHLEETAIVYPYEAFYLYLMEFTFVYQFYTRVQCWTEGRSSTAVAEDFRPTATVAKVLGHSYGRRFLLVVFLGSSKMEAEMCFSLHRNVDYDSIIPQN